MYVSGNAPVSLDEHAKQSCVLQDSQPRVAQEQAASPMPPTPVLELFEQVLGYWAPGVGIWHWGWHKEILQRFHTSLLGSALVLDEWWFAPVLAQARVQFGSVILSYASQTSLTVTGLLSVILLDGFWWNMPMCSNIIDHLAQVLLLTCILNELTFVLACFVFCQNSSYLQWACFSNVLLSALCLDGGLVFHWFQRAFDPHLLIDTALNIQFFLLSVGVLCKNMYSYVNKREKLS